MYIHLLLRDEIGGKHKKQMHSHLSDISCNLSDVVGLSTSLFI